MAAVQYLWLDHSIASDTRHYIVVTGIEVLLLLSAEQAQYHVIHSMDTRRHLGIYPHDPSTRNFKWSGITPMPEESGWNGAIPPSPPMAACPPQAMRQ